MKACVARVERVARSVIGHQALVSSESPRDSVLETQLGTGRRVDPDAPRRSAIRWQRRLVVAAALTNVLTVVLIFEDLVSDAGVVACAVASSPLALLILPSAGWSFRSLAALMAVGCLLSAFVLLLASPLVIPLVSAVLLAVAAGIPVRVHPA